jgi:hypothetical protein
MNVKFLALIMGLVLLGLVSWLLWSRWAGPGWAGHVRRYGAMAMKWWWVAGGRRPNTGLAQRSG